MSNYLTSLASTVVRSIGDVQPRLSGHFESLSLALTEPSTLATEGNLEPSTILNEYDIDPVLNSESDRAMRQDFSEVTFNQSSLATVPSVGLSEPINDSPNVFAPFASPTELVPEPTISRQVLPAMPSIPDTLVESTQQQLSVEAMDMTHNAHIAEPMQIDQPASEHPVGMNSADRFPPEYPVTSPSSALQGARPQGTRIQPPTTVPIERTSEPDISQQILPATPSMPEPLIESTQQQLSVEGMDMAHDVHIAAPMQIDQIDAGTNSADLFHTEGSVTSSSPAITLQSHERSTERSRRSPVEEVARFRQAQSTRGTEQLPPALQGAKRQSARVQPTLAPIAQQVADMSEQSLPIQPSTLHSTGLDSTGLDSTGLDSTGLEASVRQIDPLVDPATDVAARTLSPIEISPMTSILRGMDSSATIEPYLAAPLAEIRQSQPEAMPTIHVTIGRIEVKASTPPMPQPPLQIAQRKPALSLDEYLKGRSGGYR